MNTFATGDVVYLEHKLRVDRVNRYGWLRTDVPRNRRTGGFRAIVAALIASIFTNASVPANDSSPATRHGQATA